MIEIDPIKYSEQLTSDGAIIINDFLNKEEITTCLEDFKFTSSFNNNNSFTNFYENQVFISQPFLRSKKMFDIISNDNFHKLYSRLLDNYTLRSSRYYETLKGGEGNSFLWHHDEKSNEKLDNTVLKSIILIIYYNDVLHIKDGPFQFIKGSHKYSHKFTDLNSRSSKNQDFRKINVNEKYKDDIITVFGKAGTALMADGRVIHRATRRINPKSRKVFFMQVCSIKSKIPTERILIDPSYIDLERINDFKNLLQFFGYGLQNTKSNFPPSKLKDKELKLTVFFEILNWSMFRILRFYKRLFKRVFKIKRQV